MGKEKSWTVSGSHTLTNTIKHFIRVDHELTYWRGLNWPVHLPKLVAYMVHKILYMHMSYHCPVLDVGVRG